MFYIIGLGLGDPKDITVKGLEIVKKCDRVYLEAYTSILTCGKEELEKFYGRPLIVADRDLVELGADDILAGAEEKDVALLVVGDPFGATTHTDFILRAKEKGIKFQVVHNASILNAVGCCGLQLYSFGETVSIPFWTDQWQPDSFFDKIVNNVKNRLHTLCLLDIKVKEPTLESLTMKKKVYMPPKFMMVSEAALQLLQIIDKRKEQGEDPGISEKNVCVGLARVGSESQKIVTCSLKNMSTVDLGGPLHSLIVVGPIIHPVEMEYLVQFEMKKEQ
ncbi:diphthine methyl ester synthase [Diabrotica virgifera virgifera]|uniref:diphthine methyl ester synthase n=1 Tax=Diabrotica virgifera virgifera TaxID=50390 RepID=A0A6P7FFK3_DIAVI|nr:diphthine methyl ester synthase [Diabrotica virgifera virgifera]